VPNVLHGAHGGRCGFRSSLGRWSHCSRTMSRPTRFVSDFPMEDASSRWRTPARNGAVVLGNRSPRPAFMAQRESPRARDTHQPVALAYKYGAIHTSRLQKTAGHRLNANVPVPVWCSGSANFQQGSILIEHDTGPRIGVVLGVCPVTVPTSPRFPGPSR
jgi:hypothetical protein